MGNSVSFENFKYSVAVEPGNNDSSPVYRAASHPSELVESMPDMDIRNIWEMYVTSCKRYPHRPYLGRRFKNEAGVPGPYEWITYAESRSIAMAFGTALIRENICPRNSYPNEKYEGARALRLLGFYSKNCVEWLLAEHACNGYGVTLVPLYDTLGAEAVLYILKQTQLECTLVSFECLKALVEVLRSEVAITSSSTPMSANGTSSPTGNPTSPSQESVKVHAANADSRGMANVMSRSVALKRVILVDPPNPKNSASIQEEHNAAIALLKEFNIEVLMWHEVCAKGRPYLDPQPDGRASLNTLCYTSGTTGAPKGVLITHGNVVSLICSAIRGPVSLNGHYVGPSDVYISYLPLAHVLERLVTNAVSAVGGCIGVYSGDMTKLLDDIKVLAPTVFVTVPRLFFRINDKISASLLDKLAPAQMLFNQGLNSKLSRYRADASKTHKLWDPIVFNKIRQMMGGRLKGMICGGAPLDPLVQEKMTCFFSVPVMQGYGLTESFGPAFLMHPNDPDAGHIGGLFPSCEFKLVSVPEMNYKVTDSPPTGELCLRGPSIAEGYFDNPEETAAAYDSEKWFHTGDIAAIIGTHLAVKIIDRKKNIFKLSQGEYVAPEKIENTYCQAMSVGQCFVFGYSSKTVLVAIVVPDAEIAVRWALKNGKGSMGLEQLCKLPEFKEHVSRDMNDIANKMGLKGFEKVKEFTLDHEEFTVENNLLTPTIKIRRNNAKQKYQKVIDQMYESLGQ